MKNQLYITGLLLTLIGCGSSKSSDAQNGDTPGDRQQNDLTHPADSDEQKKTGEDETELIEQKEGSPGPITGNGEDGISEEEEEIVPPTWGGGFPPEPAPEPEDGLVENINGVILQYEFVYDNDDKPENGAYAVAASFKEDKSYTLHYKNVLPMSFAKIYTTDSQEVSVTLNSQLGDTFLSDAKILANAPYTVKFGARDVIDCADTFQYRAPVFRAPTTYFSAVNDFTDFQSIKYGNDSLCPVNYSHSFDLPEDEARVVNFTEAAIKIFEKVLAGRAD